MLDWRKKCWSLLLVLLFLGPVVFGEIVVKKSAVSSQVGWIQVSFDRTTSENTKRVPRLLHVLWCSAVSIHQQEPSVSIDDYGNIHCTSPHTLQKVLYPNPAIPSNKISIVGLMEGLEIDPSIIGGWDPRHRADLVVVIEVDRTKKAFSVKLDMRPARDESSFGVFAPGTMARPVEILPNTPFSVSHIQKHVFVWIAIAAVACIASIVLVSIYNKYHPAPIQFNWWWSKQKKGFNAYIFSSSRLHHKDDDDTEQGHLTEEERENWLKTLGKGANSAWSANN